MEMRASALVSAAARSCFKTLPPRWEIGRDQTDQSASFMALKLPSLNLIPAPIPEWRQQ
jgi:hypothetical protein